MRGQLDSRYALLALVATLFACTNDNTAVVAPALDATFVGYSNPDTRQTTCGNCHIDRQRTWQTTLHAQAWADLQATGQASSACYKCHTTNGATNLAPDTAGYFGVSASAQKFYTDVQCESCHGPGGGHITSPDASQPLSTVHADTAQAWGCGTCHTGTHNPFVDQWKASLHSNVEPAAATSTNVTCRGCHSAQGALARFDPKANYIEKTATTWEPIACAVCHDPHGGTGNPHQLRFPVNTPDLSTNLCMQCHYRNSVPDPTSSRGAHSPQGPMLLGEAGWVPPNFQYDATQQASTHGTSANPNLCATCHMEAYDVTDNVTGKFVFHSAGHLFRAIPCVDANGQPIDSLRACPDAQRRFNACAAGGCHATGSQALADRQVLTGRLMADVRTIWIDANGNGAVDAYPTDSGLVALVKKNSPCDFSTSATPPTSGPCLGQPAGASITTVGEGAWFNADMIQRADGSYGVHNPIYAEALLLGSISALHAQYSYLPSPPPAEQAAMSARMRALGMRP
jgi:hypothetical protein